MTKQILLVEDEENLLKTIKLNLNLEGYEVTCAETGTQGVACFHKQRYDLVILDVMLPELDGFAVCKAIRLENKTVPILFLTAKGSGEDKVFGLKAGADDYLTKPFHLEEFLLRVKILLRRAGQRDKSTTDDQFFFGPNSVHFATYEIKGTDGKSQTLGKKEIMLLKLLIERQNEVVSREEILEVVWGEDASPSTRTIDNYILAFRRYFEENQKQPRYFHSIRGVGYKFTSS
ncbi:MAG TPA: response regulator transcription factor [Bacteroidia bacterium]|jgi:two-component system alkaline phosphatase synthesis response regulator PhoP|nr:response regulator transcription factor [Bacteroidia bacterium]